MVSRSVLVGGAVVVVLVLGGMVVLSGGDDVPDEQVEEVPVNIYTASEDTTLHHLDMDGEQQWTYEEPQDALTDVAVGPDGRIRLAGLAGHYTVGSDGSQVSTTSSGEWLRAVAVDGSGNVYLGDGGVRKLSPDGEELWTYEEHFDVVHGIAVYDDTIYTASDDREVHKISASGDTLWRYTEHTGSVYDVAADDTGAVYTAAADGVHKVSSDGEQQWTYEGHGGPNLGGVTVRDGLVYTVGDSGELHVLDAASGERQWTYSQDVWINDVAVDRNGFVYTAGNNAQVHKVSPDGEQVWTYTEHSGHVHAIAVVPAE